MLLRVSIGARPAKPGNAQGFAFTNAGAYEARCSRHILIGGEELANSEFRVDGPRADGPSGFNNTLNTA
jgi:hypothetical protein